MGVSPAIFLSYASSDRDFAGRLAGALEGHRVRVWWDQGSLRVGSALSDPIRAAIGDARWFGLVLSPRALGSPWVAKELDEATAREKRSGEVCVLPLLIEECDPSPLLDDRAHADFRRSFEIAPPPSGARSRRGPSGLRRRAPPDRSR